MSKDTTECKYELYIIKVWLCSDNDDIEWIYFIYVNVSKDFNLSDGAPSFSRVTKQFLSTHTKYWSAIVKSRLDGPALCMIAAY